jgi:hypothetical protein
MRFIRPHNEPAADEAVLAEEIKEANSGRKQSLAYFEDLERD